MEWMNKETLIFFVQTFCFSGDVAVDGCRMERLAGLAPAVELLCTLTEGSWPTWCECFLCLAQIHVVQSAEVVRNTHTKGHTFAHQRVAMQKLLSECKAVTSNSAMNRAGFDGAVEVEIPQRRERYGVVTCCLSAAFRVLGHVLFLASM